MPADNSVLHTTHRNRNRHWHLLLLLIPSIVFVLVLSLFVRNKYIPTVKGSIAVTSTPIPYTSIDINGVPISARLAINEAEHAQGLSGVSSLDVNEGMLFVFPNKTRTTFWMKDMKIPLDIIWVADHKVVFIHENVPLPEPGTTINNLKRYYPNDPIDHVIEVNAGFVQAHNIKIGDPVNTGSL